jgi:hypothetical protein
MIKIFLLFGAWLTGMMLNNKTRLAIVEAQKPYTPPEKPGTGKPKIVQDLFALVKYAGNGAISISGKIGGTVFSSAGVYGPFIRNWDKPRRVRNAATTLVRGVFSGISSAYKTLTPTQVSTWVQGKPDYLRKNVFGDIKHLTPNNVFQRVNNVLTSLGLASVNSCPAVGATDSVTAMAGAASVGGATFTLTPTLFSGAAALPANTYAKVYASRQVNDSKQSFGKSDYRYIGFFAPATAIPLNIFADYTALYGGLVLGKNISLSIELVNYVAGAPGTFSKTGLTYANVVVAA